MASHDQNQGSVHSPDDIKHRSVSPSLHGQQYHDPNSSALGVNPSMAAYPTIPSFQNPDGGIGGPEAYGYGNYLSGAPPTHMSSPPTGQSYPLVINTNNIPISQSFETTLANQLEHSATGLRPIQGDENFSNMLHSQSELDFSLYQNHSPNSGSASEYDSSLMMDPQMHQRQSINQAINPADLVSPVSNPSPSSHPSSQDQQHSSPGPMSPPGSTPGTYYTPRHSRHASLDPATAYMTSQTGPDWQSVMNNASFRGHRRAPSEVSEVSSANHSPYLSQHEFDGIENNASPSLAPQPDPSLYDPGLGMESFTLSEQQQQGISPLHSPYISPRLMPQQGGEMVPNASYLSQFPSAPTDMYGMPQEDMMNMGQLNNTPGDIGQASQMAPPSINVEFAPPLRNTNFDLSKSTADFDSLSPPAMRSRMRSKSDPYHPASRPRSPAHPTVKLEPHAPPTPRSLSPIGTIGSHSRSNPGSRDPSPSRSNRRLSTSSIENRNYILDLADPQRPGAAPGEPKRIQKHPATFQCSLCPKRFTRAYNLRSHLRTHTDERPFVCTVCGKAFARQHDRKRHEGLHSGEKKFVCRGELSRSGQWGCGRRFARADALGRHFRSEAGRVCIKPLLDEESQERDRVLLEHQQQQQSPSSHLQPIPQPLVMPNMPGMDGQSTGNFILPAALLAQYPALQTLQWDQIPAAGDDAGEIGGRSSFDASSGGEFGFDEDDSGMGGGYGNNQAVMYSVNTPGQMLGVNPGDPGYDQKWSG
ncbi:Zinc finger C2H2 [Penicillium paradoxum]|uniref:Zinc finger C2H2 n=1 Tax=Penicillium paradoxum TaxID=176176 RepID=UPI0025471D55|nr:Zinc finger C2H2 [Penicillium paradoxum]KAJ5774549.1 Zinc finger C2H2 [Penicillium paradoxum]